MTSTSENFTDKSVEDDTSEITIIENKEEEKSPLGIFIRHNIVKFVLYAVWLSVIIFTYFQKTYGLLIGVFIVILKANSIEQIIGNEIHLAEKMTFYLLSMGTLLLIYHREKKTT